MGKQTTTYMPGDQYDRWKATEKATGDGRPVPLSVIVDLGLEAWYAREGVARPVDPVEAVISSAVRAAMVSLAEAGLLADGR